MQCNASYKNEKSQWLYWRKHVLVLYIILDQLKKKLFLAWFEIKFGQILAGFKIFICIGFKISETILLV